VSDHRAEPLTRDPETGEPTAVPNPKVLAATGGAVVGAAAGAVLVYVIETTTGVDIPEGVEGSIVALVAAAISFVGGYVKHPRG
jgi:hypothetical protein